MAGAPTRYQHGEVLTRDWVVDLILDLAGFTADRDLAAMVAVEPSFGRGAFLFAMADRLVESARAHGRTLTDCGDALIGVDLQQHNVNDVRTHLFHRLCWNGVEREIASHLADGWIRHGDYLLREPEQRAVDFVIGNPPYVRLEDIARDLVTKYRAACPTMSGRADLYVGFIERGLRSLRPGGVLAYICADRWMRNQYGRDLRRLVADQFAVEAVVSMHDVDAFEEKVSAYPAVIVIRRSEQRTAVVATTTSMFDAGAAADLRSWMAGPTSAHTNGQYTAAVLLHWFPGDDLWPAGDPKVLELIEHLNHTCPPLQDDTTGTRVGIGIATGNDSVYITDDASLVEEDRLLPLVMRRDTTTGRVQWHGQYLVNPWTRDGLVDLAQYPRLSAYFTTHKETLLKRHVSQKDATRWYRTIDRVDYGLIGRSKLLLPDMAMSAHPTLDDGALYPHHNLYWITSDRWDLRVLGGLLLSRVADAFVGAYGVRMRGGTMRFQAQYLRRIRVPSIDSLRRDDKEKLADAFDRRDTKAATEAAISAYGIENQRDALELAQ